MGTPGKPTGAGGRLPAGFGIGITVPGGGVAVDDAFPRRAFKSIFGFFSSAIESPEREREVTCAVALKSTIGLDFPSLIL